MLSSGYVTTNPIVIRALIRVVFVICNNSNMDIRLVQIVAGQTLISVLTLSGAHDGGQEVH